MGGRACIRGLRVTVSLIVKLIASGMSQDDIIAEYPYLETEDVHQALAYAALVADESIHALELATA
jgi:uncharacterized protein (DUF433 family)